MTNNNSKNNYPQPTQAVLNSPLYVAGSHSIDGIKKPIVLSANENPLGCSPMVKTALDNIDFNRYPDDSAYNLRHAIADCHNLDADLIVCGAGSNSLLETIVNCYAGIGDEVLYPEHGFLLYPISAIKAGATPVIAKENNYTISIDNLLDSITANTKIYNVFQSGKPNWHYFTY